MLVASRAWLPLGRGNQGPVFVANCASPQPRPRRSRRLRRWRRPRQISQLPLGTWEPWMKGVPKWWIHCRGNKSSSVVNRNTGLRTPRSTLLRARTPSSSSVHKPAYCLQRTRLTKLLRSSASLAGSFFSNWSSTRQFSPSSQWKHLKSDEMNLKRNAYMTSCNTLLPRSQPLRYISQLVIGTVTLVLQPLFSDAHGGHGFGTSNVEGERILEFAIGNGLPVGNTWFKKRDPHLIPCLMCPLKFVVSLKTASGNQKPGGGMKKWIKLYKTCGLGSMSAVPWRKAAWRWRPKM